MRDVWGGQGLRKCEQESLKTKYIKLGNGFHNQTGKPLLSSYFELGVLARELT